MRSRYGATLMSADQNFSPGRGFCIRFMLGVPRSRNFSYDAFQVMSRVGFHLKLRRAALWSWALYFGPACTNEFGSIGWNAFSTGGGLPLAAA
ncbi:MAG: hypothetical protein JF586_25555, partial [Burkholderiales bacterium]|nr:hypothetical protein [Burkholderiales bacterium]